MSDSSVALKKAYDALHAQGETNLVVLATARRAWEQALAFEQKEALKRNTYRRGERTDPRGLPEGGKRRQR